MGIGLPIPKEARSSAAMRRPASPGERTPRSTRWRGDLWTTPGEETRLCGRVARTGTRRESRRQGQEGRANLYSTCRRADRSKVLEGQSAATCSKAEEGSSERPGSRDFDRNFLPPQVAPVGGERGAEPRSSARSASSAEGGSPFRRQVPQPRGASKDAVPRDRTTLKTRRTTSPSVEPSPRRRKASASVRLRRCRARQRRTRPSVNL
jgi:hypothetical protein